MEKFERNYGTLSSYAETISIDRQICTDANDFFQQYSTEIIEDEAFEANFGQVLKMAKLIAEPGLHDEDVVNSFVVGEVLGYAVMQKMIGHNVYAEIYEAMNNLYAHARMKVNEEVLDDEETTYSDDSRSRMIGLYINHVMDNDLSFDSLPSDEMLHVSQVFNELLGEDDHVYDAMRGYSLVRASLLWRDRNNKRKVKDSFEVDSEDQTELREFYDIMADVDIDPHLADGQICVQDTIDQIYSSFQDTLKNTFINIADYNEDAYEEAKEEVVNKLDPEIYAMPELGLQDKVFVDGINVAILCDGDGEIRQMIPLGHNIQIQGYLLDYDVNPTPTYEWVQEMHLAMTKNESRQTAVPFNPFGLVMLLGEPELVNTTSGQKFEVHEDIFVFVPIGYESSTVYKIMVPDDDVEFIEDDEEEDEENDE